MQGAIVNGSSFFVDSNVFRANLEQEAVSEEETDLVQGEELLETGENVSTPEETENDSEIERMREQLEIIEYLLEKKQAVRDVLIRAALKRIDNTDGNTETKNVQRVFEKMANEAWHMWTSLVYGQH